MIEEYNDKIKKLVKQRVIALQGRFPSTWDTSKTIEDSRSVFFCVSCSMHTIYIPLSLVRFGSKQESLATFLHTAMNEVL